MAHNAPLQDKLVTVLGGSGFVGNYVAQGLLSRGARVRIASRHPEKGWSLKPLANLGQLQFARCDITNERSLRAAVSESDAVVNMVGSFSGDLMKLMGHAAGDAAETAREAGATALVHISAIGADPASASVYGRANALGEELVGKAFPNATIIRPSALFGKDDNFVNMFAQLIKFFPVLPVFGADSTLQPAFVDDVAEAIAIALSDPASHGGKTYELGGPEVITMMELNRRIAAAQGRKRSFIAVPDAVSALTAALPGTPINNDQWSLLKQGNTVSGDHPGFKQLGIEPKPLGLFLEKWMVRYRKHGRFTGRHAAAG